MHKLQDKKAFISDMDGVIYHGNNLLPGAIEFINWLKVNDKKYLFLTNSSERSPRELSQKLARLGVDVDETHFYTSALSTASFLAQQKPGGSVFVIGEAGLIQALYQAGLTMNNVDPDYVVIGETRTYSYEKIEDAVGLVQRGAMLIGTNPDLTGPTERGIVPATEKAGTFLRYTDTQISAGVWHNAGSWKAVSLGFPIETVESRTHRDALLRSVLRWFDE